MAQTAQHSDRGHGHGHGGGAFLLNQRLIVQLGIDEENPEGGVVVMEPGWYTPDNLDPRVLSNPLVKGLVPTEGNQAARNQAQAEMVRKIGRGEAQPSDMDKLMQEQAVQQAEEQKAASEAWTAKAQEAADKGMAFNELHPDPAVNYARWITGGPQYVAAGAIQSKIEPPVNAPAIAPATRPTVTPPAQRPHPAPEPAKD